MKDTLVFSARSTRIAARMASLVMTLATVGAIDALALHYRNHPPSARLVYEPNAIGSTHKPMAACGVNCDVEPAEFSKFATGDH